MNNINNCADGSWHMSSKSIPLLSDNHKKNIGFIDLEKEEKERDITNQENTEETSKKSLCFSITMLILSIPALIGSWCWPSVVIGIISGSVSAASRRLGHYISFSVTLTLMLIFLSYMIYKSKTKNGSKYNKYGPIVMLIFAIFFIMADLTRHIGQDLHFWALPMYKHNCGNESLKCLSAIGWLFTFFTYFGFLLLSISTMWNINIVRKIKDRYREIQQMRQ